MLDLGCLGPLCSACLQSPLRSTGNNCLEQKRNWMNLSSFLPKLTTNFPPEECSRYKQRCGQVAKKGWPAARSQLRTACPRDAGWVQFGNACFQGLEAALGLQELHNLHQDAGFTLLLRGRRPSPTHTLLGDVDFPHPGCGCSSKRCCSRACG